MTSNIFVILKMYCVNGRLGRMPVNASSGHLRTSWTPPVLFPSLFKGAWFRMLLKHSVTEEHSRGLGFHSERKLMHDLLTSLHTLSTIPFAHGVQTVVKL